MSQRLLAAAGLALALLLSLPWARQALEASMWRHMVLQFPLFLAAGALLACGLPDRARHAIARWNIYGTSGLTLATATLMVLMIPRVLDLALYRPEVEAAKLLALLISGAALRLSWRPAGLVLQFFFLGGFVAAMAIVGMLYMDSPVRLCNAYLLDDQVRLGQWLTALAAIIGVVWLVRAGLQVMREDAEREARFAERAAARRRQQAPGKTGNGAI